MSAGAAAGRTTVWSFTPIQMEFIGESNSEIAMLRSLGRLSPLFEGSERPTGADSIRSLPASSSGEWLVQCNDLCREPALRKSFLWSVVKWATLIFPFQSRAKND